MGALTNPYVLAVVLVISLGYAGIEAIKGPVEHARIRICHVVTLGHKCNTPTVQP